MKLKTKVKKRASEDEDEIPKKKKANPLMRSGKKPKHEEVEEDDEDSEDEDASESQDTDWLIQGRDDVAKAAQKQEMISKSSRRAPEVWVKADESRKLRFLSSDPVAVFRYSVPVLKAGRRTWISITQPSKGKPDLMKKMGLSPSLRYIYPVIDLDGFTDPQTKKLKKNLPRYFVASGKAQMSLEKMREKKGSLTKFDIDVCRTGESTATLYSFIPDESSPMTEKQKQERKQLLKELPTYYRPPNLDEQKIMLSNATTDDEEEAPRRSRSGSTERY